MYSLVDLKANTTNVITAFRNLQANGNSIAAIPASQGSPAVQEIAVAGWEEPFETTKTDFQTLFNVTGAFTSVMTEVLLMATYESARTDPLWNLVEQITNSIFVNPPAFADLSSDLATFTAQYDAQLAASGITNDPVQPLLHAYPALITAAETSLAFLADFKASVAEDMASALLWAGRDLSGQDFDMPSFLKAFKATGNTDYSIIASMISQMADLEASSL